MTRTLIALFLGSLLYTGFIAGLNIRAIREQNPNNELSNGRSLVYNSTVYSVDNYWYVNQVKNLIEHGRFTVDIYKDRYEVRRTPVYPVFFGLHYAMFGESGAYRVIRFTQACILALAVVALFLAMYRFTSSYRAAWISAVLYAAFPLVPVATQYTITEALSSELVCFFLFFLSLAWRDNRRLWWFLGGLFFALAALCRPTIIFLAVPVAVLLWMTNRWSFRAFILQGLVFSAGALVLFAPWTIRNYRLTGDVILLEKYYGDPMDYGMPNIHLRHWIACWTNPADYTSERVSNLMRANLMMQEPIGRDSLIRTFISEMPGRAFTGNSTTDVRDAFSRLYGYYAGIFANGDTATLISLETRASEAFIQMRENVKRTSPVQFYGIRHLIFLKSIIFQSNAYAVAFLDNYDTHALSKWIRTLMYLVSVLSWFSLVLLFPGRGTVAAVYWTTGLFAFLSVSGAIYVLDYYEARYSVPLLPLLFSCLAIWLSRVLSRMQAFIKSFISSRSL